METVESSLVYKINALKETWVGAVQQMLDRGDIGTIVDGLTKVSEVITSVTGSIGLLKTAALGIGAALSFKNVRGNKMHFPMNILDSTYNLLWIQRFRMC